MRNSVFEGAGVAIITPMHRDGSINYDKMEELLEYQIAHHTDAIVVAGTTGESACLTTEEHFSLVKFTCEVVGGRVPVIAGAGSNNTEHSRELCRNADRAGADALLLVTPYYNKCSQKGLVLHYKACAEVTDKPFILYNIPSRTGVNILPSTYGELLTIPNVCAVKEASGNFSQLARIVAQYGDRLDIYCGNDDQIVSALALGAKGVISVLSNVCPEQVSELCSEFFKGNAKRSEQIQKQYEELVEALFSDINPIPVKAAMEMMGWGTGGCRLPLCDMEEGAAQKLKECLESYGLLDKEARFAR